MIETTQWRETSDFKSLLIRRSHLQRSLQGSPLPPPIDPRLQESPFLQLYSAASNFLQRGQAEVPKVVTTEAGALLYSAIPRLGSNLPCSSLQREAAQLLALLGKWCCNPALTDMANRAAQFASATVDSLYLEESDYPLEPLSALTDRLESEGLRLEEEPPARLTDQSLALLVNGGVIATTSGHGTGLGAAQFGDISIRTFGPQVSPLGNCSTFGIFNPCSTKGPRHKATIDENSIKGVCGIYGLENEWLEVTQRLCESEWDIEIIAKGESSPVVFYLDCQSVTVGDTRVPRGSLAGFTGVAKSIQLEGSNRTVTLTSPSTEVRVIPLSGGKHFWGASFLIAYPPKSQMNFSLLASKA